jgi:hypothetical protein
VDASSSIQGQFDDEVAARGVAVAAVQSAVDAVEVILGTRTAAQIARVDASSSIQGQLDAKAADAAVVKKTGNQTIAQNSTAAVLILTNTNSDAPILTCVGGDGEIRLSGGNVLECDRPGSMYVRASDGTGNVTVQSRGSSKLVCDDKVRLKVEVSAEKDFTVENAKKVKFSEASGNGVHAVSLRAPDSVLADVDFELPAADGTTGQVLQTDGNGALSFVTAGGLAAASNEVISGNWTFQGPVIMNKPMYRTPYELIDTVYVFDHTADTGNILTADHSAYLYGSAGNNTNTSYFRLSSAADVGTRIAIYTYSTHSSKNKSYVGTQVNTDTIYKEGSTTHRNGWTGKGASETRVADHAKWVDLNCNDKRIFHKITADTWTY